MIVLDEDTVAEGTSVIRSTAERDRPFLDSPPAWQRLPGIEDGNPIAVYSLTKSLSQRGNPREMLKEIERQPFCHKDRSAVPFDAQE